LVYDGAKQSARDAPIEGFFDSDYVGCLNTIKSLISYIFTTYGIAISWKASLQKVMTLSTIEVEYIVNLWRKLYG